MVSKKPGVPRFAGYGRTNKKWDPRPGTVEWYEANLPELFNNVAIRLRNGLGCDMEEAKMRAAMVISWSEKPLASMRFDNRRCPGCGANMEHTDKPFPKWDQKQRE